MSGDATSVCAADTVLGLYEKMGRRHGSISAIARELGMKQPTVSLIVRTQALGRQSSWVYVVQCGDNGPIKIGFTSKPPALRVADLQVGCPFELRLITAFSGSEADEQVLHAMFATHWIRGEWFEASSEVMAWVCSLPALDATGANRYVSRSRKRAAVVAAAAKTPDASCRAIVRALAVDGIPVSHKTVADVRRSMDVPVGAHAAKGCASMSERDAVDAWVAQGAMLYERFGDGAREYMRVSWDKRLAKLEGY